MRIRAHIAGHLVATLLVALWVAQPLLAIAHAQEHAHRYCPTHRAFEETSARGDTARVEQSQDAKAIETPSPVTPGGTLLHEECAFVSVNTREELPGTDAGPLIQACLEMSCPATAPPQAPLPSLSILDTAPKASPPARI